MQTIVIVGASLAGTRAAEALRAEGFSGDLKIIGDEPPYDRPPLSKEILTGDMTPDDTALFLSEGCEAEWILGTPATRLDTRDRRVVLEDNRAVSYDGLIIATGSAPRRLAGIRPDGERILDLRTMGDAIRLRELLGTAQRLIVLGCGFIGVEVASAARKRGVEVAIVSLDPPLVQAGSLPGAVVGEMLRAHDVELFVGRTIAAIEREGATCRATLDDGRELRADGVIVAVGAVPRTEWLQGSALRLADGVMCDGTLHALDSEDIVVAGDVARWPNPLFDRGPIRIEHWNNAVEQGAAAARSLLAGDDAEPFVSVPSFWSDHFGVRLRTVGLPGLADEFTVTAGDVPSGRFAASAYRDGQLIGGITYGLPRALASIRSALNNPTTAMREG